MKKNRLGSNFDDFLKSQQLLDVAESTAIKRVIAFQVARGMKRRKLTKTQMANRMNTSRASLERLLDPTNPSVTLATLERAASVLGKKLRVEFVESR
jgi:antitoxin HicB